MKLKRLHEAATPAPWGEKFNDAITTRDAKDNQVCIWTHLNTKTGGRRETSQVESNVKLINELRNLCPAIIALIEAVDKVLTHTGSAQRAIEQSGLREARKQFEES